MNNLSILSVSQITGYLKSYIDENPKIRGIYVKGEITDFKGAYLSGHMYFSLKDQTSEIKAVMFKSYADRVRFEINNGMSVIVRSDLTVYQKSCSCQLCVYDIQPDGIGAKYLEFLQLKEKLNNEGLFDTKYKKSVPKYPEVIGVITSANGAAIHDIENVVSRRWPLAKIILTPASVQGENAPGELLAALIKQENEIKPDVIIIGRGGGSNEDLYSFNDEKLARQIFNCTIPVISAVGHEIDFSICDFVADLRAPTPSAAAELAVPDMYEIMQVLDSNYEWLCQLIDTKISDYQKIIDKISDYETSLLRFTELHESKYNEVKQRLISSMEKLILKKEMIIKENLLKLDSNNPSKILAKSVCIAENGDKRIRSVSDVKTGDQINLELIDGTIESKVISVKNREIINV